MSLVHEDKNEDFIKSGLDPSNSRGLHIKLCFRDELIESAGFKVIQTLVLHWSVFEPNYLPKVDAKMSLKLSLWSLMVNLLTQKNLCPKLLLSRISSKFTTNT